MYESDSYKAAFMLELEMIQLARLLAKVITERQLVESESVQKAVYNIVRYTLNALEDWAESVSYGEAHAESFINRACPQYVSFHYPLHRSAASILREFLNKYPEVPLLDILTIHKMRQGSDLEKQKIAENVELTFVEHPLLVPDSYTHLTLPTNREV